ncbi:hypothetical protein B0H17DRAFT_1285039 [Mycena rosella]|uniref:Uncharacterized protein n=1 Tax=Mycena rosella TaxID=1033263 RepID=A0AAD7BSK9_MYCRO|nr:hypothetical protein B0H17DRAFT_1285039 [Mycena rosella]
MERLDETKAPRHQGGDKVQCRHTTHENHLSTTYVINSVSRTSRWRCTPASPSTRHRHKRTSSLSSVTTPRTTRTPPPSLCVGPEHPPRLLHRPIEPEENRRDPHKNSVHPTNGASNTQAFHHASPGRSKPRTLARTDEHGAPNLISQEKIGVTPIKTAPPQNVSVRPKTADNDAHTSHDPPLGRDKSRTLAWTSTARKYGEMIIPKKGIRKKKRTEEEEWKTTRAMRNDVGRRTSAWTKGLGPTYWTAPSNEAPKKIRKEENDSGKGKKKRR